MSNKTTYKVKSHVSGDLNRLEVVVETGQAKNPHEAEIIRNDVKAKLSIKAERNDRMAQYLAKMDFKLLKEQKSALYKMQAKMEKGNSSFTQKEVDVMEGILNFIDSIQDIAVDEYGYKKESVFKISRK